jgi:bla regulator protein blaR1
MKNAKYDRRALLGAAALVAAALQVVVGWGQAQAGKVMLIHSPQGQKRVFEVATIKPSPDTASGLPIRITLSPAHFSATHGSVYDLIKFAYGIKSDDQLIGAPGWLKTEYFDIQAKGSEADDAAYNKLDLHERMTITSLLVQSLLADRFQLQVKVETRDLPVYALVVDKGGIKMKEVTPDPFPPAGVRPAPGAHLPSIRPSGTYEWTASAWPMSEMANWLSFSYEVSDRPVVDETGLKGNYDFVLSDVSLRPPPPGDANGPSQEPVMSMFSALPEQLGLKLVPAKAPVEVLVIDRVEQPTPN